MPATGGCGSFGSYSSFFRETKKGGNTPISLRKNGWKLHAMQLKTTIQQRRDTWEITKREYSARNENVVLETKEIDR